MSQSLGAGDVSKGRSLLGGAGGMADEGGSGAVGGVGAFYTSSVEAFARVSSSIASGGSASSNWQSPGRREPGRVVLD